MKKYKILTEHNVNELLQIVAEENKTTADALISKTRTRFIHEARCMATVILREYDWSFQRIADTLGGRNHSSIIHCTKQHVTLMDTFNYYSESYDKILYKLGLSQGDSDLENEILQRKLDKIAGLEIEISRLKHENISLRYNIERIKKTSKSLTSNLVALCN
tara:strand:- start:20 stop:505 length:486 start_codon:yes stop_codon:yes gene_type:complete